jgi:hypothetical protein
MKSLLLVAVLGLALPILAPSAAATVCGADTYAVGDVSVTLVHNKPGPPGPYTCAPSVTVCWTPGIPTGFCQTLP